MMNVFLDVKLLSVMMFGLVRMYVSNKASVLEMEQ